MAAGPPRRQPLSSWRGAAGAPIGVRSGGSPNPARPAYGARDRTDSPVARVAVARGEESDDEAGPVAGQAELREAAAGDRQLARRRARTPAVRTNGGDVRAQTRPRGLPATERPDRPGIGRPGAPRRETAPAGSPRLTVTLGDTLTGRAGRSGQTALGLAARPRRLAETAAPPGRPDAPGLRRAGPTGTAGGPGRRSAGRGVRRRSRTRRRPGGAPRGRSRRQTARA
jgi:hypothetical protein